MIGARALAVGLWTLCYALTQSYGAVVSAAVHRRVHGQAGSSQAHQRRVHGQASSSRARQPVDGDENDDEYASQDQVEEAANQMNADTTAQQEGPVVEQSVPQATDDEQKKSVSTVAETTNTEDGDEQQDGPTEEQSVAQATTDEQKKPVSAVVEKKITEAPVSMVAASKEKHAQSPIDEDAAQVNNAKVDSLNAKEAASVAKEAAKVANKVANHSMHVTKHAKSALKHALGALHDARIGSNGLSTEQKDSLKKAEGQLREATKKADYGKLKQVKEKSQADVQKEAMQEKLAQKQHQKQPSQGPHPELKEMKEELQRMRQILKSKGGDKETLQELQELEDEIDRELQGGGNPDHITIDELKAEIERVREMIEDMEPVQAHDKEYMKDVQLKPLDADDGDGTEPATVGSSTEGKVTPIESKGIDIDTQMPYGDLEPFGREDTAQELTENSVKESDEMVDQLERAEVAEEKRAVFRALTRLRGAAITSFDGVARSQTGNIDEYNKVHKWRKTHPLHHLADEESDVAKWAFPDNAD